MQQYMLQSTQNASVHTGPATFGDGFYSTTLSLDMVVKTNKCK